MSFLTDLLSQFGENYGKNTAEDYTQRDKDTAMAREQRLASLQQNVAYTNSPVFQDVWGNTDAGRQYKAQQEAELARLTQLQKEGYPTTTGQDIQQAIGNTIADTASGRPFTRLAKTEGQSKAWDKFQDFGGNAVMGLGTALAPTPKLLSGPKSIPKPMSLAPEEAGLIAKASGAKPIYGAAQKASAKAGATASPQELRSFTNVQANAGGDIGAAIKDVAAKPMQGPVLPKAAEKALKQEAKAAEVGTPKTKWQQVKKGVGTAVKVAGIATPAYLIGRNWNQNAGLPEQAAPVSAQPPFDPTFSSLDISKEPNLADQFMQQGGQTPVQKEPTFIEKLLEQVLTKPGQDQQQNGTLTEEQLLQRMEGMMNQPQPPPPQVPDNKPKSTLGIIMDALGRGLIAGGTGQADPDAAQKLEMERMTTNQNLAQNARKLTPQQEMTMQMLQSLLGNKMQQGNIAQQGAQSQQNALIQALVASQLAGQQTGVTQQFTAGQNELDRASAEKIAQVRAFQAQQKAAQMEQTMEAFRASLPGYVPPAQAQPKVNF